MDDKKNIRRIKWKKKDFLYRLLQVGYLVTLLGAALWLKSEIDLINREEVKLSGQITPTVDSYAIVENIQIPLSHLREKIHLYQKNTADDLDEIRDDIEVIRSRFYILLDTSGRLSQIFKRPETKALIQQASDMFEHIAFEIEGLIDGRVKKDLVIRDLNDYNDKLRELSGLVYAEQIDSLSGIVSSVTRGRKTFQHVVIGWMVFSGIFVLFVLITQTASRRLMRQREEALNRKYEFIAMFNHEIRNPLQVLHSSVENLCSVIDDIELPSNSFEQKDIMNMSDKINVQLERIESRLKMFGVYARLESGQIKVTREDVDIRELTFGIVNDFKNIAKRKGIDITCDIAENIKILHLDRHKTEQILRNLIENAVKFTINGGVTIVISSTLKYLGKSIHIEVRDSGSGLSRDSIKNIFDPFFSRSETSEQHGDTSMGLGLTIVKLLVETLEGKIEVLSEHGQGTTFIVEFPANVKNA